MEKLGNIFNKEEIKKEEQHKDAGSTNQIKIKCAEFQYKNREGDEGKKNLVNVI